MATKEQQSRWREKATTTRVELHLDADALAVLDRLAAEIAPDTGKPTGRSGAVRRLLRNSPVLLVDDQPKTGPEDILPVEAPPAVSYRVHEIDAVRRCQARNRNGDRCRDVGTQIRAEMIDGQRCEFDACQRHGKAEFFTPHPTVLAKGPTAQN
jgi:hypothetical protein